MKSIRNTHWTIAVALGTLLFVGRAYADQYIHVPNAAQLSFQTGGSLIYIRNLNTFDSSALGCCYNYWIDTGTAEGAEIFSILLMDVSLGQPITLGVPNNYASGAISYSGNNF